MSNSHIELPEMPYFLGGKIPKRAQILMYGPKGGGKSTLAAQVGAGAVGGGAKVACILTEQSAEDHATLLRSLSIEPSKFQIRELADPSRLVPCDADLVLVDSINGLGQLRSQEGYRPVLNFTQLSRRRDTSTLLLSHETKAGKAAGASAIQHNVDSVIRLAPVGGNHVLQIEKRRRIGAWASGRFVREVTLILSPNGFYASPHAEPTVATAIGFAQGRLVTVQALVCLPPRRLQCPFLPARRVRQLLSTLQQHAGINVDPEQIGLSIWADGPYAPTLDLAIAVAINASYLREQVPHDAVLVGALGLNGRILALRGDETAVGVAMSDVPDARLFVSSASEGFVAELAPIAVHVVGVSSISECLAELKSAPN